MNRLRNIIVLLLPAALFLGLWQGAVADDNRLQFLFASPAAILDIAIEELGHAEIWRHILTTFGEAALGLLFGTVLGTGAGLLLWGNGKIDFITRPYLAFIGAIPIFALAPITILWFGIGLLSKAVMAGFAVFFVSMLQAYEGAHAVAKDHLDFARSIGAGNGRIAAKIIIPGAIGWVAAGYKMNAGFALMGAFIGEFVSSEAGLGHYILKATALYDMPRVMFGILLLALLAMAMTGCARLLRFKRKS
ncbi:MAG: ABC transporter permease [Alphaproteobacteria bacterium]